MTGMQAPTTVTTNYHSKIDGSSGDREHIIHVDYTATMAAAPALSGRSSSFRSTPQQ